MSSELRVAMENAIRSGQVVDELFQGLERFNIDAFRGLEDGGASMQRLVAFVAASAKLNGWMWMELGEGDFALEKAGELRRKFTSSRDRALQTPELELLGLEHPRHS